MALTKQQQLERAETFCGRYLADANQALESGKTVKAEKLYEKSGYWRDKMNVLLES